MRKTPKHTAAYKRSRMMVVMKDDSVIIDRFLDRDRKYIFLEKHKIRKRDVKQFMYAPRERD